MANVIQADGLTKTYGRQVAVDHLSLTVDEGEIFGFLGPNGSGKTTSLLMLLGLTEPSEGRAEVLGYNPTREPLQVKRQVGYLPEHLGFYGEMTAWENLKYVARLNDLSERESDDRIRQALDRVGLSSEMGKEVHAYSRGMRQRLGIAELLIKNPKLVFLDEPTSGLDPDGIHKMLDLIVSLSREQKMSVLLSSHLLPQVQRICDRVGLMNKGRLVACGTIGELARQKSGQDQADLNLEDIYMSYIQEA